MTFLCLFAVSIVLILFTYGRTRVRARDLATLEWHELIARLQPVSSAGIHDIALHYLRPNKGQLGAQPHELWTSVGGAEGLQRMAANAEILVALAGHAQRWNFDESVIVAERMRRDGIALRRATDKAIWGVILHRGKVSRPFHVQEAASAYFLMRERLLALYETSHAARYPALAAAL
jgi:hypothetical protein